jgi:prepilin-type N-terminal cleavage/methylation domain-containing protein
MMRKIRSGQSGFTLIEIIVTLIVASILGAILLEFMGQTVYKSYEPINMARESMDLTSIMECINAEYKKSMLSMVQSDSPMASYLNDFKTAIDNGTLSCGAYTSTTSWVVFSSSGQPDEYVEATDGDPLNHRVLKVTIATTDHEITTLYTR